MFAPSSHLLSATLGHLFPSATSAHLFPPATSGSPHILEDYNDCSTLQALIVDLLNRPLFSTSPTSCLPMVRQLDLIRQRSDAYEPMQFTYLLLCMLNIHQAYGDSSFQDYKKSPSPGIAQDLCTDGCKRLTYCHISIETGVIAQENGSARVKMGLSIGNRCNGSLYPSWRALSSRADVRTGCDLDGLKLAVEGASIPECANGKSIGIPIPGAVSDEDMDVTGAGACVHDQDTTKLPFLYDFEELEGELDFLTRVVVLTFYPAVSARTPITLGEVPYIDNFTCHHLTLFVPRDLFASDMRLWEHINKIKQDTHTVTITNPLTSSDANNNPFSTDDNSLKSKNSSTSWVNLLSGDGIISISQPVLQTTLHDPFLNPFHDHDEASEPPPPKSKLGRPSSASRLITSDSSDLGVIMEPSLAELYHNFRKDFTELFQYKFYIILLSSLFSKLKKSKHGILISVAVNPQASGANSFVETFSEFKHLLVYRINSKF
ncbi:unnamed protein product [Lactuca saligna]|uniref:SAC9 first GBDL domain-containing protein n=1 Tax=Lactuca saligna TaxID=75948 RepID=A0AA36EPJ4_LACSI|nr:unnamed protein product [Lactuca saligna]